MDPSPADHDQMLRNIDRLLSEATDDATRHELTNLRARLSSPELRQLARDPKLRRASPDALVLEFHDPLLPMAVTAGASVIATTACLFFVYTALQSASGFFLGRPINLWLMAAVAGAFSVMFTALSFARRFSVRIDSMGMSSRASGPRWRHLRVGAMAWKNIRSLKERDDRVLEVHSATGEVLEVPMRVGNYPILREHLDNMVRLYGEVAAPERNAI